MFEIGEVEPEGERIQRQNDACCLRAGSQRGFRRRIGGGIFQLPARGRGIQREALGVVEQLQRLVLGDAERREVGARKARRVIDLRLHRRAQHAMDALQAQLEV